MTPALSRTPPGATDYALLLMLGAIWGASFMFIKLAVSTIPALPVTLLRLMVTCVVMLALTWWMRERIPPWGRVWLFIAISAVFGNTLPFLLIAWGEEHVDGGLAAILMSPMPLITAVLAHLFMGDERLERWKMGGIGLGVVGVIVLLGFDKLAGLGVDTWRQLAILAAGCCYAINVVCNRGLTGGSVIGNVTAVMLVSTAMLLPFGPFMSWTFSPSRASLIAIAVLAVFSTCVGTLLQLLLVGRQGAGFAAQVNFLVPVFGVTWGSVVLAERPSVGALLGLMLILAGVAISRQGAAARQTAR